VLSASVQSESSYEVAVLQMGGRISRANVHVDLIESNANCSVNGVSLAQARQSLDLHSSITHDAPSALSRQQQRNVIGDKGEAIFKGRIRIPKHAQLTDSDQICRTIMLGDRARVIAMPTLEITADNVVCSHGASVADLDENSMFYLASRGIDRAEARKLLLGGFMLELLDGFPMDKASIKRIQRKVDLMNPSKVFGGTSGQSLMSL
jgi:Fe-S cluster assembly protein SufD